MATDPPSHARDPILPARCAPSSSPPGSKASGAPWAWALPIQLRGSPPEPLGPPPLQWFRGNCRRGLPIRTPLGGWKPTSVPPLKLT